MSGLVELLERCKAATSGSNDLTADIYEALGYPVKRRREIVDKGWKRTRTVAWRYFDNGRWLAMADLSGSIDASLALTERVLQEANCKGVEYDPASGWSAYVSRNNVASGHWLKEAYAPTAPLAILCATLSALIAKGEQP